MRILHVDAGRTMRGGQWQVLYLLQGLRDQGQTCTLLAPESSPLFGRARQAALDVRPLGWLAAARLSQSVDLWHAHDAKGHTLAALLPGAPLVVARRVSFPLRRGAFSGWKYRRAVRYIAVSGFVKQKLVEGGVNADRVSVVYDGVPIRSGVQELTGRRVVAPASDDPLKGSALLREAATLAGVEVCFSEALEEDLLDAGLFVYLSSSEGLGSGTLLAMAAGVPVIASRIGGLSEAVEDGVTGLLVENQPAAVASAIRRLLEDRGLAASLGREGRRRVEKQFSIPAMVEGTIRVYREVCP